MITLLTDFGTRDGFVGAMKGVILSIAPDIQITDITHEISPQNIMEGALALGRTAHYFPTGTIHVAVVDPGVGTDRRAIAARLGAQYFVGPDNGLLTLLLERAERQQEETEIVHLNRPEYWLPEVSNVFHGRDVFAPVAAHLAAAVPLSQLGSPIQDPLRLIIPTPQPIDGGWRGEIIHIDRFGNLAANIQRRHLIGMSSFRVHFGHYVMHRLAHAFGDGKPGELLALFDSSGNLSLCIVNGNAAEILHARIGDALTVVVSSKNDQG